MDTEQAVQVLLTQIGAGLPHCALVQQSTQAPLQQTSPLPQALPLASVLQVPLLPVRLHAWQALSQAVLQQTPSTQWPELHCAFWRQSCPFGRGATHWLRSSQIRPATQSLLLAHDVAQVAPSHTAYGAQETGSAGVHTPAALQLPCGVTVP